MSRNIFRFGLALCVIGSATVFAYAQDQKAAQPGEKKPAATTPASSTSAISAASTPVDLARAALAGQGGDNFKNLKSLVLIGEVGLYAPNSSQPVAGKFVMVQASGDRYRLEVSSPIVQFKQVFDGQQTFSSIPNLSLPNPSKFGMGLLTRFDQSGYNVTALPDKKKQRAFRITGPDGSATDFFVDALTGRVLQYTVPFQGGIFIVEQDNMKEIEGLIVPYKLAQRFETPQGAFIAEFKVKKVNVNQPLGDDVFVIQ
ncbi:MAG: hypothetical protein QOD75_760 [Blastocatellia bacterium]|jgi:hypothetical protein|nr:hypothetical protein [Blastocatellia bacterium]